MVSDGGGWGAGLGGGRGCSGGRERGMNTTRGEVYFHGKGRGRGQKGMLCVEGRD